MRTARDNVTLDAVEAGDHVCWLTDSPRDYEANARAFVAGGALYRDKILILGPSVALGTRSDLVVRDPGRLPDTILGTVRREADEAGERGFRALRVLARMDRIWPAGVTARATAEHELGMDALAVATGTIVVCAYPRDLFPAPTLVQALSVHPHHAGTRTAMEPSFRMYQARTEHWHVSGVVDADGADAFRTAVTAAAAQDPTAAQGPALRLHCEELDFMDAAGMQALVQAARDLDGRVVHLLGVNETVRRCWDLLGYQHPDIPVELAP